MRRGVAGAFTATAAVLCEKVQTKAVCFEPDGVSDVAVHGVAFTALNLLLPAQNVATD